MEIMWRFITKTSFFLVAIIFFYVSYRCYSYYSENKSYTHYVIKSLRDQYSSPLIDGYTDKTSYAPDEVQKVYLKPRKPGLQWIKLYNINGVVRDSIRMNLPFQKRAKDASVNGYGYQNCFTYSVSKLESGLYLWENLVPFLVKDTGSVTIVYPSNTINAYNISGGKSLYKIFTKQSPVVSFLRPTFPAVSFHTSSVMKWLERLESNFNYLSDQDMDNPEWLKRTRLLIIIGHSEYWTRKARENFDNFVNHGGHALILSGNTMWWQVRYSEDGTKLICHKDSPDPIDNPGLKTTTWNTQALDYPIIQSIGADFSLGGYGRKASENMGGLKITDPKHPVFKKTGLKKNDLLNVSTKEYDGTYLKRSGDDWVLDTAKLNFHKAALLGFDHTVNDAGAGNGAFIIFQKSKTSGTIINVGTADWCSDNGIGGPDSTRIRKITLNMIEGLVNNEDFFGK